MIEQKKGPENRAQLLESCSRCRNIPTGLDTGRLPGRVAVSAVIGSFTVGGKVETGCFVLGADAQSEDHVDDLVEDE